MSNSATRCLAGLACLLVGLGLRSARADQVANLVCAADTGLWQANPDNNLGAVAELPVGATGTIGAGQVGRALFRFQLAGSVPANAVISSATLNLFVTFAHLAGLNHDLHRVLQDWGEGAGSGGGTGNGTHGTPAQTNEATWNARFFPAVPWAAPGGAAGTDYVAAASATTAMTASATNGFTSLALVADVQAWVANPATNFGWLLKLSDESIPNSGLRVASREFAAHPPVLTVSYTVPTPATPPTISGVALVGNQIRFTFNAEANRTYAVETRDSLGAGSWLAVTNLPALPSGTTVGITNPIAAGQGFFRIRTP